MKKGRIKPFFQALLHLLMAIGLLAARQPAVFQKIPAPTGSILSDPAALVRQIDEVLDYYRDFGSADPLLTKNPPCLPAGVSLATIQTTLVFIRDTVKEDLAKNNPIRLQDPAFWARHFDVFRWRPPLEKSDRASSIRVTRYAVFFVPGRFKKDETYRYALYRVPDDEQGLGVAEARQRKETLARFRYTRQMVMAGAYDRGGAKPLVWLTKDGLQKALMQGTIAVRLPDHSLTYFNVDRDNGQPFNPALKNPDEQKRYWYFAEVPAAKGYGPDVASMVDIYPGVALAGDVENLGLGLVIGLRHPVPRSGEWHIHLGILADTGGAFSANLSQLDYFLGTFSSAAAFKKASGKFPEYVEVFLFIKKPI